MSETASAPVAAAATESATEGNSSQTLAPQEIKQQVEKHKVKVNGKEIEVTLDDLKRAYGLDKASRQRFDEAAKKFKEAESLKTTFTQKDIAALKQAGWTDDEIEDKAAEFIIKRAQLKSMTPEQRALAEEREEYLRLKQEALEREQNEKKRLKQSLEERESKLYQTAFLNDISKADKNTWLDLSDPIILQNVINYISKSLTEHNYDMPVREAVKLVEEKMEKRGLPKKEYLKKLAKFAIKDIDDSDLDTFFEKGAKGIREKSVEAIKRAESPFAKDAQTKSVQKSPDTPVKRDEEYYQKELKRARDLRYGRI